jgi:L-ascorbate metabolism protein UlaG (beta-lactamase superfamily)
MLIRYLGHATFYLVTAAGTRIVTDPYEPGAFGGAFQYAAIPDPADIITISHQHADHNAAKDVPGQAAVFSTPGEYTQREVTLRGLPSYHDATQGAERGPNIVWAIAADGLRVCHLGDLGAPLAAEQIATVGPIDVLFVPVGGTFTLDARGATEVVQLLQPRLAIPMHYRTPKVKLNIDTEESFLREKRNVQRVEGSELHVTTDSLPHATQIVVLKPAL